MRISTLPARISRKLLSMVTEPVPAAAADQSERQGLAAKYGDIVHSLPDKEVKYLGQIAAVLDRMDPEIKVIYDIGANNGIWSQAFAIARQAKVYAFEPITDLAEDIRRRVSLFPNIQVVPVACGDRNGSDVIHRERSKHEASSLLPVTDLSMTEFAKFGLGDTVDEDIDMVRLDDWRSAEGALSPDLIKVDVQGYEHKVLAGGERTFQSAKYLWLEMNFRELYQGSSTVNSLLPRLYELGFELLDCVDLVRSSRTGELLYMDGIMINTSPR